MGDVGHDPELLNHFTVAVYPFVHDLTGHGLAPRLEALGGRWRPWWSRLDDEELPRALDATSFFLPYVRGLLYPETAVLRDEPPGERYGNWVPRLRALIGQGLGAFYRGLPPRPVLHLTCRGPALEALAEFTVLNPARDGKGGQHGELSARMEWVDALLFPSGLGFLLLKARLTSGAARLSELIRLNQALRLVHPPSLDWELPRLHPAGLTGEPVSLRDVIDFLLQGLTADSARDTAAPVRYTDTEAGRAHGERCPLLSYAGVHLTDADRAALAAGSFPSGVDRALFEYAAGLGLGDTVHKPMWVPSPHQAERLCREYGLAPWRCWQAMALKDGLAFLATEKLRFTQNSLPRLIEADYLPLYVYTLYQKFQLMVFADGLMREVAQVEGHLRGARALLRRFVVFRNRFWFSEVTRKPQGGELYRAIQHGLELPALYQLVTASVKEAKEYYEERWDRQIRLVVTSLTVASGPAVVGFGLAQSLWGALGSVWAVAVVLLALTTGGAAVLLLLKGKTRRQRPRSRRRGPRPADWVRAAFCRGRERIPVNRRS